MSRIEPGRKPLNVLARNIGSTVWITLKNRVEYWGKMIQCDGYMNLLLENAREFKNGMPVANYGTIFIRGNNILYIQLDAEKRRMVKT